MLLLGAALATGVLACTGPSPGEALEQLGSATGAPDATGPVVAVATLIAWLLAGWLHATALLTALARVPGLIGRVAHRLAEHVAPAAVRRVVELGLGLTVAVGMVGAGASSAAAAAEPGDATNAANRPVPVSLDWPGAQPSTSTASAPAATGSTRPAPVPAASQTVVVRPGDTLWRLAEQGLRERDGVAPADAQVAAAWPSWWAANRDVIGDDPNLLLPGAQLQRPSAV